MKQAVVNHKKDDINLNHTSKIVNRARATESQNMTREVLRDFVNAIVLLSLAMRFLSLNFGTNSLKFYP